MNDPEAEFKRELEVFRNEVHEAIKSFYVARTVNMVAMSNRRVYVVLNRHAAFWNAAVHALESNSLIVLGRIFDTDSRSHRVDSLLQLAEMNLGIFSKAALEKRKRQASANADEWINGYMRGVYIPTRRDFKRLRDQLARRRGIYDRKYRTLRNKFYAHKDRVDLTAYFSQTSIPELERMLKFLDDLQEALWFLFIDGRKPSLRPGRSSVKRMLRRPLDPYRQFPEQDWITRETQKFLISLINIPGRN